MFDKLKNIYAAARKRVSGERYRLGNNPSADWLIILSGFIACTLFIGFLSYTVYESPTADEAAYASSSGAPELISSSTMHRIIDYYEARRARALESESTTSPIDPTI